MYVKMENLESLYLHQVLNDIKELTSDLTLIIIRICKFWFS